MKTNPPSQTVRTRRAIVKLLKQERPMDANALASRLAVSAMAVRQHLYALRSSEPNTSWRVRVVALIRFRLNSS